MPAVNMAEHTAVKERKSDTSNYVLPVSSHADSYTIVVAQEDRIRALRASVRTPPALNRGSKFSTDTTFYIDAFFASVARPAVAPSLERDTDPRRATMEK